MTDSPAAPVTDVGLKPCPHCEEELRYVESKTRSTTPRCTYHEYHHPRNKCVNSNSVWFFRDDDPAQQEFIERWNTRATDARLAEAERLHKALHPFAAYGEILMGQKTRPDSVVVELFGQQITVADFRAACEAIDTEQQGAPE